MIASKGLYQLVDSVGFLASNHNNALIIGEEMNTNMVTEIFEIAQEEDGVSGLGFDGRCIIMPGEWEYFKAV